MVTASETSLSVSGPSQRRVDLQSHATGVPVQGYLAWVFERLGTHGVHVGLDLEQTTLAAFTAAAR